MVIGPPSPSPSCSCGGCPTRKRARRAEPQHERSLFCCVTLAGEAHPPSRRRQGGVSRALGGCLSTREGVRPSFRSLGRYGFSRRPSCFGPSTRPIVLGRHFPLGVGKLVGR